VGEYEPLGEVDQEEERVANETNGSGIEIDIRGK
jgi:hypothetical protein